MSVIKKAVYAAMFAALICVATMIIRIPTIGGYLNLGDCVVLICARILPPAYAFLAAGLGSALADIICGYTLYAPATFVIKGIMALTAHAVFGFLYKKTSKIIVSRIIGGASAELIMIAGYYIFEAVIVYGSFFTPVPNILTNTAQGLICLAVSQLSEKQVLDKYFKSKYN